MTTAALLLAIAGMFCWGLTWVFMKAGVDRMSLLGFGVLRPWFGLPLIAIYAVVVGGVEFGPPRLVLLAIGTGVLNAFVGTMLFYYALRHGALHETNILANTNPFWGVVSAILFLGEPASLVTVAAGLLVIAGTSLIVKRENGGPRNRRPSSLAAALGAGFLWGFTAAVPTKYCMDRGMSPITFQLLFTAGAGLAWTLATLPRLRRGGLGATRGGVLFAFLSSFFGLFVGWVLWLLALERGRASALSPLVGLILVFATALAVVFLRERPTKRMLAGGALVLAGITLVTAYGG